MRLGLGALAVLQHRAFWSGRFDLGNSVQAVWSTAHGDVLSVTALTGAQISRLGAHFEPALVVFAPLWWLWPDASLLLVCQAVAVATGAVPVYFLGRKHLASDWAAAGFALAYLLHPATQWLALDDFHVVALATPLLLWGFWFLDEDRLLPFAVVALAACLTKEEIGLVVAAMGLWYALRPGRRRAGALIASAGLLVTVIAFAIVIPHYSISGSSRFEGRYSAVGGSPTGILETAVTDPGTILSAVTQSRDVAYLADLLLPLLALPLLAPLAALTAAPGARAEPPLRHPDADIDPLPLHRGRPPGADGRGRARGGPAAPEIRVGATTRGTGDRRLDADRGNSPRAAARVEPRAVRLRPRGARARRRPPCPGGRASRSRDPRARRP